MIRGVYLGIQITIRLGSIPRRPIGETGGIMRKYYMPLTMNRPLNKEITKVASQINQ